jgi:hypothetical protein
MNLSSLSLGRVAAATLLSVTAFASQAQSIPLNNASFEQPDFGVSWFDSTGSASIAPTGGYLSDRYAVMDAGESIYQSFMAAVAGQYTVSFMATGEGRSRIFDSTDLGTPLGTSGDPQTLWGPGWHAVSYTFNAVAGESLHLFFSGRNGGFGVDNVTVTAVPEPESLAMMLAGLGAIGFMARRRNAQQG